MHLFDKIPENLFSILSSPSRRLYTDALFVLREAFKTHLTLLKEDLLVMLMAQLEDALIEAAEILLADGNPDPLAISGEDLSAKANLLIRKLKETGWIRIDFQPDSFEEVVALPDYSVALLNVMYELLYTESREYNTLVVSTYNNLKNANHERNEYTYTTLERAHQDTRALMDLLKTLYSNMGKYHQQLVALSNVNAILESHFDDFKSQIMDKIYHPFKTLDSVPRFRGPILDILNQWLKEEELIHQMAGQAMRYNAYGSSEEAIMAILEKIHDIQNTYETLDEVVLQIDQKNTLYTRATIEKIQYLISRDKTVKGRLASLLQEVHKASDEAFSGLQGHLNLFKQEILDSQSLYNRSQVQKEKLHRPVKVRQLDLEEKQRLTEAFAKSLDTQYSNEGIKFYLRTLLGAGAVTSAEVALEQDSDFMKLMLAAIKSGQADMPHEVSFKRRSLKRGRYTIPELTLSPKGGSHVGK